MMPTPAGIGSSIVIIGEYSLLASGIIESVVHVGEWSSDQESAVE